MQYGSVKAKTLGYSYFQANKPRCFYLTQRRKGAKEESKEQDSGLHR
jgi:hypothetical protein